MNSFDVLMITSKIWLITLLWAPVAGTVFSILDDLAPKMKISGNFTVQKVAVFGPLIVTTGVNMLVIMYRVWAMC